MLEHWYYTHGGQTHGPIPTEEIKRLAVAGLLLPEDLLWPATGDRRSAVPAGAALDFSALAPPPGAVPDWLSDVQQAEQAAAETPGAMSAPLDWLEDIREIEESLRARRRPAEQAPLRAEPVPEEPAAKVPLAIPLAMPVARATPRPGQATPRAPAVSPESMGFNPETGQILDRQRFIQWQRAQQLQKQQEAQSVPPTASVYEAFLKARRDLHQWVDAEQNQPLIRAGNLEAVRRDPVVQGLVQAYQAYGETMLAKLWKHLELLVENRQKFLAARG
jgi:hypothetical protein